MLIRSATLQRSWRHDRYILHDGKSVLDSKPAGRTMPKPLSDSVPGLGSAWDDKIITLSQN
jgi:hypothetical protein